jgi:hypothetical protein
LHFLEYLAQLGSLFPPFRYLLRNLISRELALYYQDWGTIPGILPNLRMPSPK